MEKQYTVFCLIFLLSITSWQDATAERMIRYIFNNGIPPSSPNICTANDFKLIDPLFTIATTRHDRNLRSSISKDKNNEIDTVPSNQDDRELIITSLKCRDNCLGYATGTCRSTACRPRRYQRALGEETDTDTQNGDDVQLYQSNRQTQSATCDENVAWIDNEIDTLIANNLLTPGCQIYLDKSKRNETCYDDIIYGEIESFNFWNMKKDSIVTSVFTLFGLFKPSTAPKMWNVRSNGFTVCNNIPLNIEAVLNPCVNFVNFTITGPNRYRYNRFDYADPMYLFDPLLFGLSSGGKYMDIGSYVIEAIPDEFAYKAKRLSFSVVRC